MNAETVKAVAEASLLVDEAARKLIEVDVRISDYQRFRPDGFLGTEATSIRLQLDPLSRELTELSRRIEKTVASVAALIPKERTNGDN